jgi:copper(I)-binding protein
MKHIALSLCLLAASLAQAQVTVEHAWVRGTVPQQKASGAFM